MLTRSSLVLLVMLFLVSCTTEEEVRHIQVNIPSADMETKYIWRTIQDISFFETHNYQVSLPSGGIIETLKENAKSGSLIEDDYEKLKKFIEDSVYNRSEYQKGYQKLMKELNTMEKAINEVDTSDFNWSFKTFDTYTVNLTLYGPGGSYDPDAGSILLFTTPDGGFKSYKNPVNTIIHEIVHIGIEKSIVQKYNAPHPMKERIVDHFVSLNFKEYLPDYQMQNMSYTQIDEYLKNKSDFRDLDQIVEKLVN
ncbi:MAG: hypothetical protein AAF740_03745, partial [Bacteroidota bacterium]